MKTTALRCFSAIAAITCFLVPLKDADAARQNSLYRELLERFDEDGNGRLTGVERVAARQFLASRRGEGPTASGSNRRPPRRRPVASQLPRPLTDDDNFHAQIWVRGSAFRGFRKMDGLTADFFNQFVAEEFMVVEPSGKRQYALKLEEVVRLPRVNYDDFLGDNYFVNGGYRKREVPFQLIFSSDNSARLEQASYRVYCSHIGRFPILFVLDPRADDEQDSPNKVYYVVTFS